MSTDVAPDAPESPAAVWAGRLGWAVLLFALGKLLLTAARLVPLAGPVGDDLARAGAARDPGVWAYSVLLYTGWSGRWAGVGLALVLGKLCDLFAAYPYLLAALQLTLPLSVFAVLSAAFADRLTRRTRAVLACGLIAVHWAGNPCLKDSYYWVTGALENHLSLSMGLLILAGLLRAGRQPIGRWCFAGLAGLAIVMPGMHELYGIYLCAALVVGTAAAYLTRSPARHTWAAITATAFLGLTINLGAPGHAKRLGFNAPRHDIERLYEVAREWRKMTLTWVTDFRLLLATLVLVTHPLAAGACPEWLRNRRGWFATLGVCIAAGAVVSAALVHWWTFATPMPGRTQSAIYLIFLIGWFIGAYAIGTASVVAARVSRPVWAALAGCWALALLAGTNYEFARFDLSSGRANGFHRSTVERDRLIRAAVAAGDRNPRVPPIGEVPLSFMYPDVTDDVHVAETTGSNLWFCTFYGLDSIRLEHGTAARAAGTPSAPAHR